MFYIIDTDVATVLPSRRSILARGRGSQSSWHGRGRGRGDDQGVEKELEPFSQLTTLKMIFTADNFEYDLVCMNINWVTKGEPQRFKVASEETEPYSQIE